MQTIDPWGGYNSGMKTLGDAFSQISAQNQEREQSQRVARLSDLQLQQAQRTVDRGQAEDTALMARYGADTLPRAMEFQSQEKAMQEGQAADLAMQKEIFDLVGKVRERGLKGSTVTPIIQGMANNIKDPKMKSFWGQLQLDDGYHGKTKIPLDGTEGMVHPATGQPLTAGIWELEFDDKQQVKSANFIEQPKNDTKGFDTIDLGDRVKVVPRDGTAPRYEKKSALSIGGGHGSGGMNIEMNGLSPSQTSALTAAIGEGRLDPYKINSKNQQILADAAVANPGINLNDMAANLGLARNKDVQMKGAIAETVPPLLKSIVDNGKKLNYSNNQFLGMAQQWLDKKSNNPQFVKYISLRNDQLLTLGGIMRSNGMTDMAQKLEEEAAQPTMSPRALEGWLEGQMESVAPRLKMYRSIRSGQGGPRPTTGGNPQPATPRKVGRFIIEVE
jgi:hypothetical protein